MTELDENKGTIFEFRVLQERINKIMKDDDLEVAGLDKSKAFIYFFLQNAFQLDRADAIDAIVDGSNDFGIDAVHIDDQGERADVYLIQSKYYQVDTKFNRSLEAGAVDKMIMAIKGLITEPGSMPKYTNSLLYKKLEDIGKLGPQARYHVIFISNSYPLVQQSQDNMNEFVKKYNMTSKFITWQHFYLSEMAKLLPKNNATVLDGSIELSGTYMLHDIGAARAVIGRVSGAQLVSLVEKHGDILFEKNVRGYLNKTNQVNKRIRESASSIDSKKFFFLNNGITVVCKKFDFNSGLAESPLIKLSDFQIVNGGQTTNSIYQVQKEGRLDRNVSVLIRIVETNNEELLKDITEATNSQTLVSSRDLHSNDPIQKLIEDYMETKGYYYESRRNRYQGEKLSRQRVDSSKAAQTYYSYRYQKPADAKSKKSKLFESLYGIVFDQDEFNQEEFLLSFLLFRALQELRKDFDKQYGFIRDAELTSLALFRNHSDIHNIDDLKDQDKIKKYYEKILQAIQAVVDEEVTHKGENFEKRRFFIAQETLGRISEKLIT